MKLKFKLSLFWSVYLSFCVGGLITLAIVFLVLDKLSEIDQNHDFYNDVSHFYQELEKERKQQKKPALQFYAQLKGVEHLPFRVYFSLKKSTLIPSETHYLTTINNTPIYIKSNGAMIAIFKLQSAGYVSFKDHENSILENEQEQDEQAQLNHNWDIEEYSVFIVLISLLLMSAAITFFTIKKLEQRLSNLVELYHDFGTGNLHVRANNQLPYPLNKLANGFNDMAALIEKKINEEKIFANTIPHELKTPLSRIQLATGILQQDDLTSAQLALLQNIETYVEEMDKLCQSIGVLSQLHRPQQQELQAINLAHLINERIEKLGQQNKLTINFIDNTPVTYQFTTNILLLQLVIDNLLSNASRHANQHIIVTLTLDEKVTLCIEDDGEGIASAKRDLVFLPYYRQDDSRSRDTGGFGLGLAIVKSCLHHLNGTIELDKSPTLKGARFCVYLPIQTIPA